MAPCPASPWFIRLRRCSVVIASTASATDTTAIATAAVASEAVALLSIIAANESKIRAAATVAAPLVHPCKRKLLKRPSSSAAYLYSADQVSSYASCVLCMATVRVDGVE